LAEDHSTAPGARPKTVGLHIISRHGARGFIIRRTVIKTPPTDTGTAPIRARALQPAAHLDSWVDRPWTDGVQVDALRDLDVLFVRTMNTVYQITVVTARTGEAIVRGGKYFPEPTRAVILGSSLGGAFLKLRGIYCGFALEVYAIGTRIVTSSVQSVHFVEEPESGRVQ
jgi:hypothetical protein